MTLDFCESGFRSGLMGDVFQDLQVVLQWLLTYGLELTKSIVSPSIVVLEI